LARRRRHPWPHGAGKTTLMKAIVGELPLLGGSIMLDSRDVGQLPTESVSDWSWICPARAFGIRAALGTGQPGRRLP